MRSLIPLSLLLSLALCDPEWATNPPTLDPSKPIYLANVLSPPEMHFLAYTPPKPNNPFPLDPLEWCYGGVEITDSLLPSGRQHTPTFTIEGMNGLKVHDYFSKQAYISRHNKKFATCYVTPESGSIGLCPGLEGAGQKFRGKAMRVWSCWVLGTAAPSDVLGPREDVEVEREKTTDVVVTRKGKETGARAGSSGQSAFTAAVTGR